MKKRRTREQKEHRLKILGLVSLMVVLACVSYYIFSISDKPIEQVVEQTTPIPTQSPEVVMRETKPQALEHRVVTYIEPFYQQNSDTIGYIKIDDTQVDYPVVYSGDNEYYMNHSFEKKEQDAGAIFMDFRCDYMDFSKTRNVILYGHRMKDGSMFKELTCYLDEDFYEQHKTFRFDTLYEHYEWEVFAVFETDISFYYIDTEYPTDEKWLNFLEKCHGLSKYQEDIKFYPTDVIVTLSTCAVKKNKRFVVMARLLR